MYKKKFIIATNEELSKELTIILRRSGINDFMDYGNDGDVGLYHLSDFYQYFLEYMGIYDTCIYTEDISDGKYLTTVEFDYDHSITVQTNAWSHIDIAIDNLLEIRKAYLQYFLIF